MSTPITAAISLPGDFGIGGKGIGDLPQDTLGIYNQLVNLRTRLGEVAAVAAALEDTADPLVTEASVRAALAALTATAAFNGQSITNYSVAAGLGYMVPLSRQATAADFVGAGDTGWDVEKVFATITTGAILGTTRRKLRIKARIDTIGFNGADTWRFRLRIGGLLGEVVVDSTALQTADMGTSFQMEADVQIRSVGAGGDFNSYGIGIAQGAGSPKITFNEGGAIDTTAGAAIVVTGVASSNNAGNTAKLSDFTVEVMPA